MSTLSLRRVEMELMKDQIIAMGTSPEQSRALVLRLPLELLLLVAERSPVRTHLELSFASRACHSLLLPPPVARVWAAIMVPSHFTQEKFQTLVQDSFGIGKFKMVKRLALHRDHLEVALPINFMGTAASLQSLTVAAGDEESLLSFCRLSFPNLTHLFLAASWASEDHCHEAQLDVPMLETLAFGGFVNVPVLDIVGNYMASISTLKTISVHFVPAFDIREDEG